MGFRLDWGAMAVSLLFVALAVGLGAAVAGASESSLPGGGSVTVTVDSPAPGSEFVVADPAATADVEVVGTAIATGPASLATIVYAVDVSLSSGLDSGDCRPVLACEMALLTLIQGRAEAAGIVGEAGVVVFGGDVEEPLDSPLPCSDRPAAVAADVAPSAGQQDLAAVGSVDVATVAGSLSTSGACPGVGEFTGREVAGYTTDFSAALRVATVLVDAAANDSAAVVLVSDGPANAGVGFLRALDALRSTGAATFAVGIGGGCGEGGSHGTLLDVAGSTGRCFDAPGPPSNPGVADAIAAAIGALLPGPPVIEEITLSIDGGPGLPLAGGSLPSPGRVAFSRTVPLELGDHDVCVTARAADHLGAADTTMCTRVTVVVAAAPPAVEPPVLDPAPSAEGEAVVATAGFTGDPGRVPFACTVDYGDGSEPQAGTATGSACVGPPHTYGDNGTYTVEVTVTDADGQTGRGGGDHAVRNVSPSVAVASSSAALCGAAAPGAAITVSAEFSDPGFGPSEIFAATVDWGDGAVESAPVDVIPGEVGVATIGRVEATHVYAGGGVRIVTVTVTDDDGGAGSEATQVLVSGAGVVGSELHVLGTAGRDHVQVRVRGADIEVTAAFLAGRRLRIPVAGLGGIRILVCAGDDQVRIHRRVTLPATVDGGSGKDHLYAGGGPTRLVGAGGSDQLHGSDSADVLFGGTGDDQLHGYAGDDTLDGGAGSDHCNPGKGVDTMESCERGGKPGGGA